MNDDKDKAAKDPVAAVLEDLRNDFRVYGDQLNALRNELRGEIKAVATTLRGEIQEVVTTLRGEIQEATTTLRGEIREVGTKVDRVDVRVASLEVDMKEVKHRLTRVEERLDGTPAATRPAARRRPARRKTK